MAKSNSAIGSLSTIDKCSFCIFIHAIVPGHVEKPAGYTATDTDNRSNNHPSESIRYNSRGGRDNGIRDSFNHKKGAMIMCNAKKTISVLLSAVLTFLCFSFSGAAGEALPESEHPYENDFTGEWDCGVPGAEGFYLTFSEDTFLEWGSLPSGFLLPQKCFSQIFESKIQKKKKIGAAKMTCNITKYILTFQGRLV